MRRLESAEGGTDRMPTAHHPTDVALAAAGASVEVHMATCTRCRARAAAEPVAAPAVDQLLQQTAAPSEMVALMRGIPDFDETPVPGELWRLEFNGTAAPAVIAEVGTDTLIVWAVGEDPAFADPATVVNGPNLLGMSFGVWTTLEFEVPGLTSERHLGSLDAELFERLQKVRTRIATGEHPGGDGASFTGDLDARLAYRDELAGPFRELADVARQLKTERETAPASSLRALLDEADLGPAHLRELGFDSEERRALSQDRLILTDEEVARIALAAQAPATYVAAQAPSAPIALVAALHYPNRRRQLADVAVREGVAEHSERRRAVRTILATSQRTAGQGEPDWETAIDHYFAGR